MAMYIQADNVVKIYIEGKTKNYLLSLLVNQLKLSFFNIVKW